jgi:hypothetical protein
MAIVSMAMWSVPEGPLEGHSGGRAESDQTASAAGR